MSIIKITAWKYIQDDQDHTIEIHTNIETKEEFEIAMMQNDQQGRFVYKLYHDDQFVMSIKNNKIF